jgi:Fe-S-cluster-containing hydrogenase component 2
LTPVPITEIRMGTAQFDPAHCWVARGQPCDYCVQECPIINTDGEKALRWRGNRPEVNEEACVGCGLCVHICTGSEPALRIEPGWR